MSYSYGQFLARYAPRLEKQPLILDTDHAVRVSQEVYDALIVLPESERDELFSLVIATPEDELLSVANPVLEEKLRHMLHNAYNIDHRKQMVAAMRRSVS